MVYCIFIPPDAPARTSRRPRHRYKPISSARSAGLCASRWRILLDRSSGWAMMARRLAPTANTTRDHFDAILVLGTPADADGNPTPEQLARVTEAVREYDAALLRVFSLPVGRAQPLC